MFYMIEQSHQRRAGVGVGDLVATGALVGGLVGTGDWVGAGVVVVVGAGVSPQLESWFIVIGEFTNLADAAAKSTLFWHILIDLQLAPPPDPINLPVLASDAAP